ncbi:hypothetical protein TNIN_244681 [Trichonephila inaurata madagascariensis]|uniref:Uncharacterized protein n=1 Tax=Trichonephila inaurata madagascariensis TaxID=2747483 RepID=A0A8X7CD46_9ARAC|nr:hypothetical protein TNIN_244681 [Trichonephila inaurata madagascariensis]
MAGSSVSKIPISQESRDQKRDRPTVNGPSRNDLMVVEMVSRFRTSEQYGMDHKKRAVNVSLGNFEEFVIGLPALRVNGVRRIGKPLIFLDWTAPVK